MIVWSTVASHSLENSWQTTLLTAAASILLLSLPQVAATCATSASLSILFPSGTVLSQNTSASGNVDLTILDLAGSCSSTPTSAPTPSPGSNEIGMQNTSIVFGALTPLGFGGVRLSAMDNHMWTANFSGLGLLPYGSVIPQNWSIITLQGNASHWNLPEQIVAEGPKAITPVPSATGVKAELNDAPYIFLVQAFNSNGIAYDSATLTINIQSGALNFGTTDAANNFKLIPTQIDTILLSTGIDRSLTGLFFLQYNFSQTVTLRHADNSRPGGLCFINCRTCNNWYITGIMFTGNLVPSGNYGGIIGFLSSTNMNVYNVSAYFNATTQSGSAAYGLFGCINCAVDDYYTFGVSSGVSEDQTTFDVNITISRFKLRQFTNNAFYISNAVNMTISDCVTIAPMRTNGLHLDNFQVADDCSPQNLSMYRIQQYKAEGTGSAQGFFAGSTFLHVGFIDDGSGNGTYTGIPGKILTLTTAIKTEFLYSTSFVVGDNFPFVRTLTGGSNGLLGQVTLQLDTPIAAPPGNVTSAPFSNLQLSGYAYMGEDANVLTFRGLAGNSLINAFTAQFENPVLSDVLYSYFNGTLIGNQLNVTWWDPSNPFPIAAPVDVQLANGTALGDITVNSLIPNLWTLVSGNFSYTEITAFRVVADPAVPANNGPHMEFFGVGLKGLYTGNTTVKSGYVWGSYPAGQPAYVSIYDALTTKTPYIAVESDVVFQRANKTFAGLCFAQGDPELGPEGAELLDNAAWAAMTFEQVVAKYVSILTPKVGGPLTNGNADYGAFTRDGLWNDGSGNHQYLHRTYLKLM